MLGLEGATRAGAMLASPWADPTHLETVTLAHLYDLQDQAPLTRGRAMKVSTVSKARRIIATNIGRLPLQVIGKDGQPIDDQPALIQNPEPGITRATTLTWLADSLMFDPCAWWVVTSRDWRGFPASVKWVPWEHARMDEHGQLLEAFGEQVAPGDGIRFDSPDSGLLIDGSDIIRRAIRLNASAARAEDNPVPVVDLHNTGEDLTGEEIDDLIARWQRARQAHGIGYSSRSLEVKPMATPSENLLVDGRKAIVLELARACGVPGWAVDAQVEGSSLTYANVSSRNRELIDTALAPYMTAITARLSMPDITPRGTQIVFDTDALTTPEPGDRFQAWETALRAGFITKDEVRKKENLPPLAGHDERNS